MTYCVKENSQPGICEVPFMKREDNFFSESEIKIVPKPYNYMNLIQFLDSNYNYRERHSDEISDIVLKIFKENCQFWLNKECTEFEPVFLEIIHDAKSEKLFSQNSKRTHRIILYIERISGYFETNSNMLNQELCLVRGVTEEDIELKNNKYHNYVFALGGIK